MRDYFLSDMQAKVALHTIQEHCKAGIVMGPKFCLPYESEDFTLVPTIKAISQFMRDHGLEGVFMVVLPTGATIDIFKRPGIVTKKMIRTWIDDLTVHGVVDPNGGRCAVCPYDEVNLHLSSMALLNSCSYKLREMIVRMLPDSRTHTGPLIYYHILQQAALMSFAHTRKLTESLTGLRLHSFPGENVMQYMEQALSIIEEIEMTSLNERMEPDLAALSLVGLTQATDDMLRMKASDALIQAHQNCDDAEVHASLEPLHLLLLLQQLYKV